MFKTENINETMLGKIAPLQEYGDGWDEIRREINDIICAKYGNSDTYTEVRQ
jgi:hypothetical protein